MLDELQTWWQNTTPESRTSLQTACLVAAALLGGHFLGAMLALALRQELRRGPPSARLFAFGGAGGAWHYSNACRRLIGSADRLGGGCLVVCPQSGPLRTRPHPGTGHQTDLVLAAVLTASLALGGLLARRLIDCLHSLPRTTAPVLPSRNGGAGPRWDVAGAVGAGVYVLVVLLVLLMAADLFDWPLTRTSALALWQLAQHLLIALAALTIGCLGAGWANDVVTADVAASPEKRAGQYTALGIVAATTVLAVAVLLSTPACSLVFPPSPSSDSCSGWVRGYLPDITAWIAANPQRPRGLVRRGSVANIRSGIRFLSAGPRGEFFRMQNRVILEARLHGCRRKHPSRSAAKRLNGAGELKSSRPR